jgi:hypothetical protein
MVESNSNRFRSPSVFKTVQGPALITFHYSGTPCWTRTNTILLLRETPHTNWAKGAYRNIPILTRQRCLRYTTFGIFLYGPACRNRTHIRRVEADCIIHYTNARKRMVLRAGIEPA